MAFLKIAIASCSFLILASSLSAQPPRGGPPGLQGQRRNGQPPRSALGEVVRKTDKASPGYTLIAPLNSTDTRLIDLDGDVVHTWPSGVRPGNSVYLLDDGSLLRTGKVTDNPVFAVGGGSGGRIQHVAWDGDIIWDFFYSNENHLQHHDIEPLPNGNVLLIAWEKKTEQEAIDAGRDPTTLGADRRSGRTNKMLWTETIVEIRPGGKTGGEIVWQWNLWDHLVQDFDETKENYGDPAGHAELVDLNFYRNTNPDWIHMNSVAYNEELDQIVMSARWFNEVWVIDHSTTTEEAASHSGGKSGKGGDLLYRWGNPRAYRAGSPADQKLFAQHDADWIQKGLPDAGELMVFNNGDPRINRGFSTVDQWDTGVDQLGQYKPGPGGRFGPVDFSWSYRGDFNSERISGAQRLPNGNTLICSGGSGHVLEVTPAKEVVWEYRLTRGAPDGPRGGGLGPPPGQRPPGFGPPPDRGPPPEFRPPEGRRRGPPGPDGTDRRRGGPRARRGGPPGGGGGGLFRAPRFAPDHPAFAGRTLKKQEQQSTATPR